MDNRLRSAEDSPKFPTGRAKAHCQAAGLPESLGLPMPWQDTLTCLVQPQLEYASTEDAGLHAPGSIAKDKSLSEGGVLMPPLGVGPSALS